MAAAAAAAAAAVVVVGLTHYSHTATTAAAATTATNTTTTTTLTGFTLVLQTATTLPPVTLLSQDSWRARALLTHALIETTDSSIMVNQHTDVRQVAEFVGTVVLNPQVVSVCVCL